MSFPGRPRNAEEKHAWIQAREFDAWETLGRLARTGEQWVEKGKQAAMRGLAHGQAMLHEVADLERRQTQRDLENSRPAAQRVVGAVEGVADVGRQALARGGRTQIEQGRLQAAGAEAGKELLANRFDINQRNTARASASGARRRPKAVDIYVGGGGDFKTRNVASYADEKRREHPERDVLYYGLDSPKRVEAVVDIYGKAGIPVNIVGHSWGASRGGQAAEHARGPIAYFATIDPVGRFEDMGQAKPRSVARWDNVVGVPSRLDQTDWIARIGGEPSALPIGSADRNVFMDANHGDFAEMMDRSGVASRLYGRGSR